MGTFSCPGFRIGPLPGGLEAGIKIVVISPSFRFRLLIGSLLLVTGAGLVAFNSRVLSTFFIDVVIQTVVPDPRQPIEPFDFSWGTMHVGHAPADFSRLCAGLMLIAIAHFLVTSIVLQRIRSAAPGIRRTIPKLAMVAASFMTLLAAGSFLLIPVITKGAFSSLAVAGAVDPAALGEDLPVLSSRIFMVCLVAAQILLVLAIFTVPQSGHVGGIASGGIVVPASCACLLLFALLITVIRFGPVRVFSDVAVSGLQSDPVEMARQCVLTVKLMIAASPLLAAAAVLTGILVLRPVKSGD